MLLPGTPPGHAGHAQPAAVKRAGAAAPTAAPQRSRVHRRVDRMDRMAAAAAAAPAQPSTSGQATPPSPFLRPHLLKLAAYTPIEPFEVLSQRFGRAPEDIIKLDANENPYGPPPEVRAALGTMAWPNIYPDPETRRLRAALAEMNDIPAEHLLVRAARGHGRARGPSARMRARARGTMAARTHQCAHAHAHAHTAGGLRRGRADRPAHAVCAGARGRHRGLPAHLHHVGGKGSQCKGVAALRHAMWHAGGSGVRSAAPCGARLVCACAGTRSTRT